MQLHHAQVAHCLGHTDGHVQISKGKRDVPAITRDGMPVLMKVAWPDGSTPICDDVGQMERRMNENAMTPIPAKHDPVTYLLSGSNENAAGRSSMTDIYTIIPATIENAIAKAKSPASWKARYAIRPPNGSAKLGINVQKNAFSLEPVA